MGRECRRVPANWQHPKYKKGRNAGEFRPLLGGSFSEELRRWEEREAKWKAGLRDDGEGRWKPVEKEYRDLNFEEWDGERPRVRDYMPDWPASERTHYQMYENTSEGTPISPVMSSPEELAQWLVDNEASAFANMTASYEAWLRICRGGNAPSVVAHDGELISGVEARKDAR